MYKVFIENKALHILEKKDYIPNDSIVIYEEYLENFKESLFQLLFNVENRLPIYLISPSIEVTFLKLFEGYDFIEAAGGIVQRKDSFLFIKRSGLWDIPKGKMEKNEIPTETAVREIEEECGIVSPEIDYLIGITYHTYFYKGRPTIKKTYWYALNYNGIKKTKGQLEEGITQVKWLKKDELNKVKKNTYTSIIEVMDLYFKDF
jgi:8-oxo-dGTP pyrophosphatase MutT (NUDIX family)